MASGITSASTLSRAFAGEYLQEFISVPTTIAALLFIGIVALINFRGIRESVRTNVVLTLVEVTGLVIIVVIGIFALGDAETEVGRNFEFKQGDGAFGVLLWLVNRLAHRRDPGGGRRECGGLVVLP